MHLLLLFKAPPCHEVKKKIKKERPGEESDRQEKGGDRETKGEGTTRLKLKCQYNSF